MIGTDMAHRATTGSTPRAWPVFSWLPGYQRSWLRPDVIAGLTVCAILVPEGMAYAELAGVPPEFAFYSAPAALLAYAALGTSRQLVVAVSSAIAIMSAATIGEIAVQGSAEFVALTAALAILAGLVSIAAGILKLGRIAQFFSQSVLTGFVFGLALLISIKQIPKLLGIEAHGESAVQLLVEIVRHVGETDLLTLAVGLAGIAGMLLLEHRLPRLPAALVVLLASIAVSVVLGLEAAGVHVVGDLPAGLAGPSLPGVGIDALPLLFLGAVGIALVAFAEAVGPAHEFARRHGGHIDQNRELVAIGAANASAGLFSGFPIGSSLSKSAANERAGARTPASLVTAAAATALVALFLTPLFEPLPEATLGAIVIVAVMGMMKVGKMRQLWELRRADFWLAAIALVGVLVVPTLQALGIAVLASLGVLIWRTSEPRLTFLGRARGGLEPLDLRTTPEAVVPGLVIVRPDEMLYFANAASIREGILEAAEHAEPACTVVLLDLSLTPEVDVPVVEVLERLHEHLETAGVELWLSHLRPGARKTLERAGVLESIGRERIHARTSDGILAYALRSPGAEVRVEVINDILVFVRERRMRPGTSTDAADTLDAIERRLVLELQAAAGAGIGTSSAPGSPPDMGATPGPARSASPSGD
jgi:sulfate permease, SulP family